MNRRPTMQDVADRAKVSKSAVSLAYNDPRKLSATTLENILAAASELGYSQDPAARMLRRRRTDSLGLLLPQQLDRVLENPYYTLFMQGIGQVCQREGFTLLLAPPLRGSMLKAIPYAAVDGFIVCGLEFDRGEVTALQQRGVPSCLSTVRITMVSPASTSTMVRRWRKSSTTSSVSDIADSPSSPSRRRPMGRAAWRGAVRCV
jgi:DNA-binding LacI/PurR family transcriptional regulator